MKDWAGNTIEVGHTVVVVNYRDMFAGSETLLYVRRKDGTYLEINLGITPEGNTFKVFARYDIVDSGNSCTESAKEHIGTLGLAAMSMFLSTQSHQILCIEGLSDNEEEFYKHYFK